MRDGGKGSIAFKKLAVEAGARLRQLDKVADGVQLARMKSFFTGDAIRADLLVMMLEKHGIAARQEFVAAELADDEDEFTRRTRVLVPEADYDRAHQLFYEDDGKEL